MRKPRQPGGKVLAQCKRALVKTTLMELVGNLIDRSADDAALIASVKRIFAVSDVRLARSFVPIRLVAKTSVGLGKRGAGWT